MKVFLLFVIVWLAELSESQEKSVYYDLIGFASDLSCFEGFSSNKGENEYIYQSLRSDNSPSLLTRCTTGEMAIEWETGTIPASFKGNKVSFIWLAANDLTPRRLNFYLFVNGEKRFTIPTTEKTEWKIENEQGFALRFFGAEKDQHGDVHGYMNLEVPEGYFSPGRSLCLKLVGEKANDNTWMIVYRYIDALSFMRNTLYHNFHTYVEGKVGQDGITAKVKVSGLIPGNILKYRSGKKSGEILMRDSGNGAEGDFILPPDFEKSLLLFFSENKIIAWCPSLSKSGIFRSVEGKSVIETSLELTDRQFRMNSEVTYKPELTETLEALMKREGQKGKIYLMNSSHQDIAWMDDIEKCVIERDTMLLTPLIKKAMADPSYRFDVEDALMLKEYIGRHPDLKPVIKRLLDEGIISCGSSYIQPYEEMYSGESLIRQFYFGKKWLRDEFGYEADTYWNVDVPGRTLQMPQILAKSGVKYLTMSRFRKGVFRWFSPDGSSVLAYSPGHYADAFRSLQRNFNDASLFVSGEASSWMKYFEGKETSPVMPILSDWDMSPARDYSQLIGNWNKGFKIFKPGGEVAQASLPEIKTALAPEFLRAFDQNAGNISDISGERPPVWLYIHGPTHGKAIKSSREGDILLTMAEKFATIDALVKGNFLQYPEMQLSEAWEAKIYPDHGWGGKNGQITDDIFWQKFDFAKKEANEILQCALKNISAAINTDKSKGKPLIVFNSLNWERNCPVSFNWNFSPGFSGRLIIKDIDNNPIPCQQKPYKYYPDGSVKNTEITFIASATPSFGYKTYYINEEGPGKETDLIFSPIYENKFYRIEFGRGGLKSIFDKELGEELINSGKFLAGEVFTMQSVGNDAGEFSDIQHPDMAGFDRISWHAEDWKKSESGTVYSAWKTRSPIRNATVELTVKLFNDIKRIDIDVALLNWEGVLYREFRLAIPVNASEGKVAYEVPFGVVEVGKSELKGDAGERYTLSCDQFHPRGIENWIGSGNDRFWVTLSSSVSVADYIDPTADPVNYPVLQPVLLASRKSCHGLGPEYLQTGNHFYTFSLTSHAGGWKSGYRFGREANEKLQAVLAPGRFETARLPEAGSFFKNDNSNFWISTIKKTEDRNSIIIRGIEWMGEESKTRIVSFIPFNKVRYVTLIESPLAEIKTVKNELILNTKPFGIETIEAVFNFPVTETQK